MTTEPNRKQSGLTLLEVVISICLLFASLSTGRAIADYREYREQVRRSQCKPAFRIWVIGARNDPPLMDYQQLVSTRFPDWPQPTPLENPLDRWQ